MGTLPMDNDAIARVQVAGVHDVDEAALLAAAGAEWIGIPLRLPVNREDVTDAQATDIVDACKGLGVVAVLITYLNTAMELAELAGRLGVSHIQIHGGIEVGVLGALRERMPGVTLIKSLVVRAGNAEELGHDVDRFSDYVDAYITDTFDPATGASGATGLSHDWRVSRDLVRRSPKPVIAAGGLTPDNVCEAVTVIRPAGVDVHTGVERPDGRKDAEHVQRFVAEAKRGFAML